MYKHVSITTICEVCGMPIKKTHYAKSKEDAAAWEDWAKHYYTICSDCYYDEQFEIEAKEHPELADLNLPELRGNNEQRRWARTVRGHEMLEFLKIMEENEEKARQADDITEAEFQHQVVAYLARKRDSGFWLKNYKDGEPLLQLYSDAEKAVRCIGDGLDYMRLGIDSQPCYTLKGEKVRFYGLVTMKLFPDRVQFFYPKNDTFIDVMHEEGCEWSRSTWEKKASSRTPSMRDCAARIASRLISKGFVVELPDEQTFEMTKNDSYEEEHLRWIVVHGKRFALLFPRGNDALYNATKEISGSKWESPFVTVSTRHWMDLETFAEKYHFRFDEEAQEIVDQQKEKVQKAIEKKTAKVAKEAAKNAEGGEQAPKVDIMSLLADED